MKAIKIHNYWAIVTFTLCSCLAACSSPVASLSSTPRYDQQYGLSVNQSLEAQKRQSESRHPSHSSSAKENKTVIDQFMTGKTPTTTSITSPFQE